MQNDPDNPFLEPAIHAALMKILSALYESKLVEHVSLDDVLNLFGVENEDPEGSGVIFAFDDPGWVHAYNNFKDNGDAPMFMTIDEDELEQAIAEGNLDETLEEHKDNYNKGLNPEDDLENWEPPTSDPNKSH